MSSPPRHAARAARPGARRIPGANRLGLVRGGRGGGSAGPVGGGMRRWLPGGVRGGPAGRVGRGRGRLAGLRAARVGHRCAVGGDLGRAAGCRRQVAECRRLLRCRAMRLRVGVGGAQPERRRAGGVRAAGAGAGGGGLRGARAAAGRRRRRRRADHAVRELLRGRGQVWMTATEASLFDGIARASRFHVQPGQVTRS